MTVARTSLRQRILLALFGYVVALTIIVGAHGFMVNEYAERLVWRTLLDSELDHIIDRSKSDPSYRWVDSDSIMLFDGRGSQPLPQALDSLAPGIHDEFLLDGIERVMLVREVDGGRMILALDITDFEQREIDMGITVVGSAITMALVMGLVIAWVVSRLARPLSTLAARIARLQPDRSGQRIAVPDAATSELVVIADALNDYLERNDRFVERERAFIDTTSHELRTPIAIIAGASAIALGQDDLRGAARGQLTRIHDTARDVERLIGLLLMLARDPARLATISEPVQLGPLVEQIVESHRHLTHEKDLSIDIVISSAAEILAPLPIVQAAIGNLLRNAIENSDRGTIRIGLSIPATITIADPGHGMAPEEIGAIYARLARGGGGRDGSGIGLDLIGRLCDHLGWSLELRSEPDRGTIAVLRFHT